METKLSKPLLDLLREKTDYNSIPDLSSRLNVDESLVLQELADLESSGYEIEHHPLLGVRLLSIPDLLLKDEILSGLETKLFGRGIYAFQRIASTNDFAYKIAERGEKEGTLVIAEEQTRGRGRMGRIWHSPKGMGLWFSLILRPPIRSDEVNLLTFLSALSVAQVVERRSKINVGVKWPNDLLIKGRKFCGILSELSFEDKRINFAIVGIGINLNQQERDFPPELRSKATSLRIELGDKVDRVRLLQEILKRLEENYFLAIEDIPFLRQGWAMNSPGFGKIIREWESRCVIFGKKVTVIWGENQVTGIAQGIDKLGRLILKVKEGSEVKILAGDVHLCS